MPCHPAPPSPQALAGAGPRERFRVLGWLEWQETRLAAAAAAALGPKPAFGLLQEARPPLPSYIGCCRFFAHLFALCPRSARAHGG